jgi:hypothetical protein
MNTEINVRGILELSDSGSRLLQVVAEIEVSDGGWRRSNHENRSTAAANLERITPGDGTAVTAETAGNSNEESGSELLVPRLYDGLNNEGQANNNRLGADRERNFLHTSQAPT